MDKRGSNVNIKNRRASFDYIVTETYTAGIVLTDTGKTAGKKRFGIQGTYRAVHPRY